MNTAVVIEVFRGLLHKMVQTSQDAGSNGTKKYSTTPPTVRIAAEQLGEKATAKITKSAMAIEIEEFIREISKGKGNFQNSITITPAEKQEFTVIVCCSWDEPEMSKSEEKPKTVVPEPKPVPLVATCL